MTTQAPYSTSSPHSPPQKVLPPATASEPPDTAAEEKGDERRQIPTEDSPNSSSCSPTVSTVSSTASPSTPISSLDLDMDKCSLGPGAADGKKSEDNTDEGVEETKEKCCAPSETRLVKTRPPNLSYLPPTQPGSSYPPPQQQYFPVLTPQFTSAGHDGHFITSSSSQESQSIYN